MIDLSKWQPVIGLEIHAQLNTRSKIFSPAPNAFGAEPNTNIGLIDTGQPGTLPLLNREAVRKAILFGIAIDAQIPPWIRFDRKSYFYPDSPRNFQITQFDHPIVIGGQVFAEIEGESKKFTVEHAHLEDDAGMLKHFSSFSGVDYNRAGAPLIEIVSDPCMHSPKDASAYAKAIRAILQYTDVSECNMEEGMMRMDVNISVKLREEKALRPKIEIKNLNSFTNMEMAIEAEIIRQVQVYEENPDKSPEEIIESATYRFDLEKRKTIRLRSKEQADDYRYFPEPDIPPVLIDETLVEDLKKMLPELPHERFKRYIEKHSLTPYNASILINEKTLSDYFEEALRECESPTALCNWITVEFSGRLKEKGLSIISSKIPAKHIGQLVSLIEKKVITGKIAKKVADDMVLNPEKPPEVIVNENPDYKPMSDVSSIEPLVDRVLEANPQSIEDYIGGKDKAYNFLVGQVMKLCRGKASPDVVKSLLDQKLPPRN